MKRICVENSYGDKIWYVFNKKTRTAIVSYNGERREFDDVSYSNSIVIPKEVQYNGVIYEVKKIGKKAFRDCSELTNVTIPCTINEIESSAFECCDSLKSISIPNSVKKIGKRAFYGCNSLEKVTISSQIDKIEEECFKFCYMLKDVVIPEGIKVIAIDAFWGCWFLNSVTIPSSVNKIGLDAFSSCEYLIDIIVAENNLHYSSVDGVLLNRSKTEIIKVPEGKSGLYKIPDGVSTIGRNAFDACKKLTQVSIPSSVTMIEPATFLSCDALNNIIVAENNSCFCFEDGVLFNKSRTNLIFVLREKLGEYTIPNDVIKINDYAFYCCSNLISVKVPSSVKFIGDFAFDDCKKLNVIIDNPENCLTIGYRSFGGCKSVIFSKSE